MTPAEIQARVDADPALQAIIGRVKSDATNRFTLQKAQADLRRYLAAHPDLQEALKALPSTDPGVGSHSKGWGVDLRTGKVKESTDVDWWVIPASLGGVVAGGLAVGAAAGAAGGTGAAAAGSGAGISTGAAIPAAGATIGGTGVSGTMGAAATGGGMSAYDAIFQYLLPAAGSIYGTIQQGHASSDAAKEQARLTEIALDDARKEREYQRLTDAEKRAYDRRIYDEERGYARGESERDRALTADQRAYERAQKADALARFAAYSDKLNPYLERGNAAGDRLSGLLQSSGYQPSTAHSTIQGAQQMVRVQAPDGSVRALSETDAQRALQLGAVRV